MKQLRAALRIWFPIAIAVTTICLLIFATVQHSLRASAYDPQIGMAEDAAARLDTGIFPLLVLPENTVEITKSVSPYIIVFDAKGNYLASSATLDGKPPTLPVGVFDHAKAKGEHRISWQPMPGVRSAVVIVPFKSSSQEGYVVAGRSLREVEQRIQRTFFFSVLVWCATVISTLAATLFIV